VGALIGTWGSYWVRMTLAKIARRDLPIALLESGSAIFLAVLAIVRLHHGISLDIRRSM
jgi:uncharacterized membrane protein